MPTNPPCDCLECGFPAEWEIFPRRIDPTLVIRLCEEHHGAAIHIKAPRQELYAAANQVVRMSLSGE